MPVKSEVSSTIGHDCTPSRNAWSNVSRKRMRNAKMNRSASASSSATPPA